MTDATLERAQGIHVAAVSDALDALGERQQVLPLAFTRFGLRETVVGWAFTIQGARSSLTNPAERIGPRVIDEMPEGSVACYATGGVMDVGVWGELWTAGSVARGCVGAVVESAVRDSARIADQDIGIYALGTCPRDAVGRFTVTDRQVPILIGGVRIEPGDLVMADSDGVVVIPRALVDEVLDQAGQRVGMEKGMRDDLVAGKSASRAYTDAGAF